MILRRWLVEVRTIGRRLPDGVLVREQPMLRWSPTRRFWRRSPARRYGNFFARVIWQESRTVVDWRVIDLRDRRIIPADVGRVTEFTATTDPDIGGWS